MPKTTSQSTSREPLKEFSSDAPKLLKKVRSSNSMITRSQRSILRTIPSDVLESVFLLSPGVNLTQKLTLNLSL